MTMTARQEDRVAGLGAALRRARLTAGLSQAALAERVGTSSPMISQWENEFRTPLLRTLLDISAALSVNASSILQDMESSPPRT